MTFKIYELFKEYKDFNTSRKRRLTMARQYENLDHINVKHFSLVRSDKRERRGKVGSTSKENVAIRKQIIACNGNIPRCEITGQFIPVSTYNKRRRDAK